MRDIRENDKNTDIKKAILESACLLMVEKGIKETSLKDIAEKVGISKGTLYYYYSAKEDIIVDIADGHLKVITDELLASLEDIGPEFTKEQILANVFDKILGAETRGRLNLYLIGNAITSNDSLKQRFKEKYREWQMTIEKGLNQITCKRISDKLVEPVTENRVISFLILTVLDGLIIQRVLGVNQIPVKELVKLVADIK